MSIIKTERLFIRPYLASDRKDYLCLVTDEEVMLHIEEDCPSIRTAQEWWEKIQKGGFPGRRWCVESADHSKFMGHVLLNPYGSEEESLELGYLVTKKKWGKGFGTEIARAMVDYSRKSLKVHRLYATVEDDHQASINVLLKAEFEFLRYDFDDEGRFSVYIFNHGENRESTEQIE